MNDIDCQRICLFLEYYIETTQDQNAKRAFAWLKEHPQTKFNELHGTPVYAEITNSLHACFMATNDPEELYEIRQIIDELKSIHHSRTLTNILNKQRFDTSKPLITLESALDV